MALFSRFSKPAFWTQFLIGILAVFALPAVSSQDSLSENIADQQQLVNTIEQVKQAECEQCLFLQQDSYNAAIPHKQAVEFCIFSAKLYRLESVTNPPIRAGPTA